ncbi:MAG: response regulator [Blastochloris sp.]|nr:response regulator [Blastochloris sp.]
MAGRGVGLDVVKGEIEAMNGSVNLDYQVGSGSTWTIKVPLTLSASEALVVSIGTMRLALPLSYVQRCVRILPGNLTLHQGLPHYRDERGLLPCLHLGELFQLDSEGAPLGVVVDSGLVQAVLRVDTLIARREIVTKDLGSFMGGMPHLAGATMDSDGSLLPILQLPNILQRMASELTSISTSGVLQTPTSESLPASVESSPVISASEPTPTQSQGQEPPFVLGRPPRILLCDDSVSVRRAQVKQLSQLGYEVTAVNDGQEALERAQQESFDLLMTDLEMPRMDGFELVRAIRALPALQSLPIIVITSRALEKFASETVSLGATACLGKPFVPSQFERLLQSEAQLYLLRRQNP